MTKPAASRKLITHTDLRAHFHESVDVALNRQGIAAAQETTLYLVNLLTSFVHTARLFEPGDASRGYRPLALLYADAVHGSSPTQRYQAMRRLGDVALFVAGIFTDSLRRRVVDVDYYIAMGGNAYAYLSDDVLRTAHSRAFQPVFRELADKFTDFVDVLNEVSEAARLNDERDILRLYDVWLRTGSKRAAARLRKRGIEPNAFALATRH